MISSVATIVGRMKPVSLAEMDEVSLQNRVDVKYVFSEDQLPGILEEAIRSYQVLNVDDFFMCPYDTLYFDTPGHDCYCDHHRGRLSRHKFRMRKYASTGLCFMEVKSKNNKGRTNKERLPIEDFEQSLSSQSAEFVQSIVGTVPDLVPQLQSRFTRITLVGSGISERVTLDCELEFRHSGKIHRLPGLVITEVKQERDSRHSVVREIFRGRRIRPRRVSKYCLGSLLLKPYLKHNRFKPNLRAIQKIV